ncbi:helix-turn-helix domain-containing protein [Cesiribacter andamanensis]|uniref:helix-turn-helix domain-containing protein n=1 Tax=Cesiribacter andamanensis TaxID=649507 RepID=UPI001377211F
MQEYAGQLQLSTAYLSRLVQEASGEPAAALIRRRLLLEARRRLLYSPQTNAEIGYALGFSDASNFNRFFKKAEGCTPKEFRSRPNDH